ncbi:MAG: hypothetical protein J6Y19_00515, partial [Kiritimatiellae bacterium]|nr:hypothetical protein [Kiritimatiellia bacterium]
GRNGELWGWVPKGGFGICGRIARVPANGWGFGAECGEQEKKQTCFQLHLTTWKGQEEKVSSV